MDPAITVAVVSVATAIVTTAGGVLVAFITNRREAENAADDARASTLQERITLRDEQIAALERKVQNRDDKIARLELEVERLVKDLASCQLHHPPLNGTGEQNDA